MVAGQPRLVLVFLGVAVCGWKWDICTRASADHRGYYLDGQPPASRQCSTQPARLCSTQPSSRLLPTKTQHRAQRHQKPCLANSEYTSTRSWLRRLPTGRAVYVQFHSCLHPSARVISMLTHCPTAFPISPLTSCHLPSFRAGREISAHRAAQRRAGQDVGRPQLGQVSPTWRVLGVWR